VGWWQGQDRLSSAGDGLGLGLLVENGAEGAGDGIIAAARLLRSEPLT